MEKAQIIFADVYGTLFTGCSAEHPEALAFGPTGVARLLTEAELATIERAARPQEGQTLIAALRAAGLTMTYGEWEEILPTSPDGWARRHSQIFEDSQKAGVCRFRPDHRKIWAEWASLMEEAFFHWRAPEVSLEVGEDPLFTQTIPATEVIPGMTLWLRKGGSPRPCKVKAIQNGKFLFEEGFAIGVYGRTRGDNLSPNYCGGWEDKDSLLLAIRQGLSSKLHLCKFQNPEFLVALRELMNRF